MSKLKKFGRGAKRGMDFLGWSNWILNFRGTVRVWWMFGEYSREFQWIFNRRSIDIQ